MVGYTALDMLNRLGGIFDNIKIIRDKIPIADPKDARHLILSGIQSTIMTLLFLFGSLEYIDDNNIELRSICRLPGKSRVDILNELELQTKLTLLVFVHFKIEALFSDILLAVDSTYNVTNKFLVKAKNLLERLTINEEHEKYDCYKVMSIIRNSLHNNSNNMNGDFDATIKGHRFQFKKGEPTKSDIFEIIFLIEYSMDSIDEIINSPEVLQISGPIKDLFYSGLDNEI